MKFPIIFVPPFARTRTWTFLPSNVIARLRMVARETREEVQRHCIFIFRLARESLEWFANGELMEAPRRILTFIFSRTSRIGRAATAPITSYEHENRP